MTAPDLHSPRVTAIIPAYNAAAFVRNAIDSALAQAWPNIEVLVIDDGSTDDTASILQAYGEAIRVVSQPNGGLSNARNRGIHEATGTYVAFLDADDRWLPGKIARQVQALTDNPQAGFCSTVTQVEAPDGTPTGEWGCPQIDTSLLHTLFLRNGAIPGSGSGVMARRALFNQVGGFDETLRSLEDIDMWMRLAAVTGYVCIDEPLTIIVKHPDSMSRNLAVMRAAALQVMRKNRHLLPPADRGAHWQAGYASVLADFAKWEYRSGQRLPALLHLAEGLLRAPVRRGRMLSGLIMAVALGRAL